MRRAAPCPQERYRWSPVAMSSFRAKATTIVLHVPLRASAVRFLYYAANALFC